MNTLRSTLLLGLTALMSFPAAAESADTALPAPVQTLQEQGLLIVGPFHAPDGMSGYAAMANGQPLTIYVTPGGQHAIIGTLLDKDANNLSTDPVRKMITDPQNEEIWSTLEKESAWVANGRDDAPHIIYMFDDPECPYCHVFWQQTRPWVEAGKVQVRHILVGIIARDSPDKAAAILSAANPADALRQHEEHFRQDGYRMDVSNITAEARKKISKNESLMHQFGIRGTPAIYYPRTDGSFGSVGGMPQGDMMAEVMGGSRPGQ